MPKQIKIDDDGLYSVTLDQAEITLLYMGVIPYIAYDHDPMIPDNEFLWVHQEIKPEDKFPCLDPFPCRVLSCVQFLPDLFILTLEPDEVDIEFEEYIAKLRIQIDRNFSTLRTQVLLDSSMFN